MQPKKSLGQNFLTSEAAVFKIVQAAKIAPRETGESETWKNPSETGSETILEVGPGRGVLTKALLETGAKIIAVEKDHALCEELRVKFVPAIASGQLTVIEGDILNFEPAKNGLNSRDYKIVANIPYYITGQFLRKFLSEVSAKSQPKTMVLLLQKEVVERIIAADKKESVMSVSVKAYGTPKKIAVVNRGSFYPAPNVDSAIIAIENISKKLFDPMAGENSGKISISEKNFFEVVKAGFAHKRKMLTSNLESVAPREKVIETLNFYKIPEKIRAEDLTVEQWGQITGKLFG